MLRLLSPAAVALLVITAPAAADEAPLRAGFAETDVSPKVGGKTVYVAGFGHNRKATAVHDPIMARAVVLAHGKQKLALVSVDVVGLFLATAESVRKELPGFEYVLVSSTHNHEGPDTLGLWGSTPFASGVDPEYMKALEAGIVKAVKDADAALQPVTARIGVVNAPDLLNDSRLPIVKQDELVAIEFAGADKKPVGVLVQWNCHPETLGSKNTQVSADFVASTVKELRTAKGCPVAYFTGVVGGLMSSLKVPLKGPDGKELADGTFEKTEEFGRLVAKEAEKALAAAKPVELTPFEVRTRTVHVPIDNRVYQLGWQLGVLKRDMYVWEDTPYPKEPKLGKDLSKRAAARTEIGYLKLGELEMAVIPGEIYPELVLGKVQDPADPNADFPDAPVEPAVYAQLKGKYRMVIGLGNDEIGYIIPKRQWDEKAPFCYGLKKSQYGEINSTGPETAPILCAAFAELVKGKK
jgi:hypothetical protein